MRIYIVYEGEFTTDKPREYMAEPYILLATKDKDKAIKKFEEVKSNYIDNWDADDLEFYDDFFRFNNYKTYGQVGIIDVILE